MVLCLGSVWYLQFRGLCLLYSFICEFCNVGQTFIWERIFFARNVKAFSGYLRKPKNIAMYTIFNVNVCTLISVWLWNFKYGGSEKRFLAKNQQIHFSLSMLILDQKSFFGPTILEIPQPN